MDKIKEFDTTATDAIMVFTNVVNVAISESKFLRKPKVIKVVVGSKEEVPEIHKGISHFLQSFLGNKFDKVIPCGKTAYYVYLKKGK